jgi:hypothetical protein
VPGNYGWIQSVNFLFLILSVCLVGFGLKRKVIKTKLIVKFFYLLVGELSLILIFPINSQFFGLVHYSMTFLLVVTISTMLWFLIKDINKSLFWKKLIPYFIFVLLFNLILGLFWFVFDYFDFLNDWRGLFQKVIVLNMVTWLFVVGLNLWKFD